MAALQNTIGFIASTVLMLVTWLAYLWCNNLVSKLPQALFREVAGGVLNFALFAAIGVILYFFRLPLSMGILLISMLLLIWYVIRKSLRSATPA